MRAEGRRAERPDTFEVRVLEPPEPLAPGVRALTTLRWGGASAGPYASFNLATHVGDSPTAVRGNRRLLRQALGLPSRPLWLRQVHGARVVAAATAGSPPAADAAVTAAPQAVLAVLTADCFPVVFASRSGIRLAIAHAGWRGLAAGVLEAAVAAMKVPAGELRAWIGPGIGAEHYEVGPDVYAALRRSPGAGRAFRPAGTGRWQCALGVLVGARLAAAGIGAVAASDACTWCEADRFFSYRRDGPTGRMATLVWREGAPASGA